MKRIYLILAISFMTLLLCTPVTLAREVTVQGYGTTRDEAINDALRNAVEQAVGTLVDSQTLVQNAEVVKDEIYTKSRGFVQDWTIVSEQRSAGQTVITARVQVDTNPNSRLMGQLQRLKLIEQGLRDPRIGVIIPEYHISAPIPDPAGETAVIKKLIEAGFSRMVDARQIQNIRYTNTVKSIMQGNRDDAISFASSQGLDYIIIGEAFSTRNSYLYGLVSCGARLEAKIIKADTGEVIATNGLYGTGVHSSEFIAAKMALNEAGEKMGDYMVQQLMAFASNPEKGVQLIVKGITSYNKISILESELKQLRGVKNVYVRGYNGGIVTIDINYTYAPKTLASELEKLSGINLSITDISNSGIQAMMKY
ncbi:hypothetical protein [Sporomusa malonica]|uniref:Flagellar assembly protein T N-terminal domain-containing protein n=1 Tax=Sporomusa malonica TaxID=112901 RepID=A0A1W2DDU9_9FIRM|nr:hypothetical protein [Sporomusa malonica]SMC95719.1 hypothetical protein SAMN04488500_11543 [Sporomusa malonica]